MNFVRIVFFSLLCAGLLGGCKKAPEEPRTAEGRQATQVQFLKDDLGREINLKAPARRVVCIGPGATETIFELGAGDKLVGRDQVSDYPQGALKVPIAGDYTGPFVEKVVALKPDLVIVQGETYDRTRANNWQQKIGVPVAILVPTSVHEVASGIGKIGAWLDNEKSAAQLVQKFQPYLADKGLEGEPKAFFEVQRSPLWTAGKGTLVDSVMGKAEVANIALGVESYKQYNLEALLAQDPDLYILSMAKPDTARALKELRRHPKLRKLRCIQAGKVIVLPADWVLRPGPRLLQGIAALKEAAAPIKPKQQP